MVLHRRLRDHHKSRHHIVMICVSVYTTKRWAVALRRVRDLNVAYQEAQEHMQDSFDELREERHRLANALQTSETENHEYHRLFKNDDSKNETKRRLHMLMEIE